MQNNFYDISSTLSIIDLLFKFIGVFGIYILVYRYIVDRKKLSFEVMSKCIQRYIEIAPNLNNNSTEKEIKQYLELCNEELFYFKEKYLSEEVCREWLDGMINYLPHFNQNDENYNSSDDCIKVIHDKKDDFLKFFPRIKAAFTVDRKYDINSDSLQKRKSERSLLINLILKNLNHFSIP